MKPPVLVAAILGASCSQHAPQPAPVENRVEKPAEPTVYQMSGIWAGGAGCTPSGDELTLTGTLIVRPFGHGNDGALLDTGGMEWILTYRAEGPLLELAGQRVVAHGRACTKEGQAIYGHHFDLATIALAP